MDWPLKDVQRTFGDALLHPNAESRLLECIEGDARQSVERIAIYRGNLTQTWFKVLASAYPVLRALLGDDFFLGLTREYGLAQPSGSGDLNLFGHRIADLLAVWPPCTAYPYLADVAELEWAVHRAYFAADASSLSPEDWLRHSPEELEEATLVLHPAFALLSSPWRIADIWLAHKGIEPAAVDLDVERPQHAIVARPLWLPHVHAISHAAFDALDALRRGETLGAALDAAFARDPEFDFATNWRTWIELGIVVAPRLRTCAGDNRNDQGTD